MVQKVPWQGYTYSPQLQVNQRVGEEGQAWMDLRSQSDQCAPGPKLPWTGLEPWDTKGTSNTSESRASCNGGVRSRLSFECAFPYF